MIPAITNTGMVMDRFAKQQIKRQIMFTVKADHEKANSIFSGKTLRDDGIVFVKSSLKGVDMCEHEICSIR